MPSTFVPFGRQHLFTLLAILSVTCMLPWAARARPRLRLPLARFLGAALLGAEASGWIWYGLHKGSDWRGLLPLDLCDLAALVTGIMLLTRSRRLHEIAYFWGFGGTLQALLTPDLQSPFPSPGYWFFFLPHGLVIVDLVYAGATLGLRPTPRSILRAFAATALVALCAAPVDWLWGTNYLYLRAKPQVHSLMDYLGPWPWYVLALVPVCLAMLCLCYLPYGIADRFRDHRRD